ncbi:hypothetical protein GLOIN_2v1665493, partial [Rhizophagus irregularis DAOM 181602=DAOM 197198]
MNLILICLIFFFFFILSCMYTFVTFLRIILINCQGPGLGKVFPNLLFYLFFFKKKKILKNLIF